MNTAGPWWLPGNDPILLALAVLAAVLLGLIIHHVVSIIYCRRRGHWLGLAAALVTAAPLLGLLGTVSGLIDSFAALAITADARSAGAGIGRALTTTQMGLLIAVPGLLAVQVVWGLRPDEPTDHTTEDA
ncbi:MAG: MotA/TolQ/ExbB proton channel family protein [Planctomycetota bacterium]|nr:MAG: MotA/TolQ/ExbB proton channel family protein [Planctomycetota bacterium]